MFHAAPAARLVLIPTAMGDAPRFDVSVILPFGDDEEAVGIAVRRTAAQLRQLGLGFEILAIDEDSGDNSHAVLALLRAEVPELRVTHAPGRGKGVDAGVARAQGTLLVVSTPDVASASLDGMGEACRRLFAGEGDAEVAVGRFTVAHRVRSLVAFRGARLVGAAMHRRLAKRLQVRNLSVRISGTPGTGASSQVTPADPFRAQARGGAVGRLRAFAQRRGRVA